MNKNRTIVNFIKDTFNSDEFIPLHEPKFIGNEKKYLNSCIDSTFVSSVGEYVDRFERDFASYIGSKYAIACVNGTSALHLALVVAGIKRDDEVITQALSFIATSNAISYCGAKPIFIDVDKSTLGMSLKALERFLNKNCQIVDNRCINKNSKKVIKACIPMHTFGHPCKIDKIAKICKKWHIKLIEDSAESLGSLYKSRHTGTFGDMGVFSFNGNKIITSGGGGVVVTNSKKLAQKLKHLSTTAKVPHKWEYVHNEIGFNYRLPNINAALLLAQLENIDKFLKNKRELAYIYKEFFDRIGVQFLGEPKKSISNYWLNAIICNSKKDRDKFLEFSNSNSIMTRPIWKLLSSLDIYKECYKDDLKNSKWLEDRVVNIPSSVRVRKINMDGLEC